MAGPFIKVNKADWVDHDYYLNMDRVSRMWQEDNGTTGLLIDGEAVFVTEGVQEVLQRFADANRALTSRPPTRRASTPALAETKTL